MLLEAGASLEREHPADLCQFAATSTAAIQARIDRGVNVRELRILDDGTPLHVAARRCRDADVFEMLVKVCGIDLEARKFGETDACLHFAITISGNVLCDSVAPSALALTSTARASERFIRPCTIVSIVHCGAVNFARCWGQRGRT
jgi:hypothetical protein